MDLRLTIHGTPQPQGSARAFVIGGRAVITSSNKKLKPWRQEASQMAAIEMRRSKQQMIERPNPVRVAVRFCFAKPKSAKKDLWWKTTKPDSDKLLRAVLDSLTGIVFEDDSQVVVIGGHKVFDLPERTEITVESLV